MPDRRAGKCSTVLVPCDDNAPGAAPPSPSTSSRMEARRVVRFRVASRCSRRRHAALLIPDRQSSTVNRAKPRKAGVSSWMTRLTARGRLRPSASILKSIARRLLRLLQSAAAFLRGRRRSDEATKRRSSQSAFRGPHSAIDLPPVILGQGDYTTVWPPNPEPQTPNPYTDLPQRGGGTTPTPRFPTRGSPSAPPRPQSSIVIRQSSIMRGHP